MPPGCLAAALIHNTAMVLLRLGWVYFQSTVWNTFAGKVQWSVCISSHSWQVILATLVGCVRLYARDESQSLCGFLSVWAEQRQLCESQKQNRLCRVEADLLIWELERLQGSSPSGWLWSDRYHTYFTQFREPLHAITILAYDLILQWQLC